MKANPTIPIYQLSEKERGFKLGKAEIVICLHTKQIRIGRFIGCIDKLTVRGVLTCISIYLHVYHENISKSMLIKLVTWMEKNNWK